MTQIHNVVESPTSRYVLDPDHGMVQRRELVMRASDVDRIKHGDDTFEVQPDGSFEVPADVAAHYLRMPGWHEGPSPFAPEHREPQPQPHGRKVGGVYEPEGYKGGGVDRRPGPEPRGRKVG